MNPIVDQSPTPEQRLQPSAAGATVTFAGMTRNGNAGRQVLKLEYEAYEPMALSEMRKLALEAGERFIQHALQDRPFLVHAEGGAGRRRDDAGQR